MIPFLKNIFVNRENEIVVLKIQKIKTLMKIELLNLIKNIVLY